ncbi:MAG: DUF1778 domain-containing protein [Thermoleophilaceae bacterium]|nr:DUF1778 domain-containing protein [Thermoleophilaceae bacterium]
MRSVRLDPDLDDLVRRAAAQEGSSVSEFLRLAAVERAQRIVDRRDQLTDVIGAVRSAGGTAARTGSAFSDLLEDRKP